MNLIFWSCIECHECLVIYFSLFNGTIPEPSERKCVNPRAQQRMYRTNKSSNLDPKQMDVCTNWWRSLAAETQRQDVWHKEMTKRFALGSLVAKQFPKCIILNSDGSIQSKNSKAYHREVLLNAWLQMKSDFSVKQINFLLKESRWWKVIFPQPAWISTQCIGGTGSATANASFF